MSARKRKLYGLPQLRPAQPRAEVPDGPPLEERRLGGAFEVPLDQVFPDPDQPRRDWAYDDGEQRLAELAASVREFGVIQPLVVREDGALPDGRVRYAIIAGGRRRAAAERAGLRAVPVVVRGEEGARVRVLQLLENLQRQALSPLDEARAYQELLDTEGGNPSALASRVHVSDQHIRGRLRLLADQVVSDAVERRQLPVSAARVILQLPDEEMFALKERIRRGETLHMADVMGVRERLRATGVINPRFKGGGRAGGASPSPPATAPVPAPGPAADQTVFDPPAGETTPAGAAVPAPPPVHAAAEPAASADQTVFDPGTTDADRPGPTDAPGEAHPAVTALFAARIGAELAQALAPAARERLAAALDELERRGPAAGWLPDLYRGLRQQLDGVDTSGADDAE
ncbi:MAG TPA: ParB/RepB/Spo0J family partition protein [Thermomicrobiales bacterium]|nr:ParB/RepB/Spo0J family partition protein [Thermomicrobiales bacterium]